MPTSLSRRLGRLWLLALPAVLFFSSCATTKYYEKRTLFRLTDSQGRQLDSTKLRIAVNRTERNYVIQPNDFLEVRVNTNRGERILDPNGELQFGQPGGGLPSRSSAIPSTGGGGTSGSTGRGAGPATGGSEFLVQADGTVVLPMVNRVRISGLTLLEADSMLALRYNEFYKESFVSTRVTNNRVVVMGATGGQVIPLNNDNMNLLEVLALAGGIDGGRNTGGGGNSGGGASNYRNGGKANDIRIIRGDLKNPRVQQIDLSTLDGMRRANLQVEPNDVIYVEPIRRPFLDALADLSPIITLSTLLLSTTFFLINQFSNRQ
ncbi:polysaccharide biosynthesis/export family protein [Hymenobacter sp. BT683]|uniref:Polysaccharide biosynthesis/export family protein n=1 Tax=Hymenobacter jeongseonensis TaxID=2791027 RepID=A0ABS0IJA0_9BACT|nr:polysaccharide biosynthesis/export family protein [Hymenobacter jeongseonensis]MBF9238458.1 polysaccharide biosynthesis/export family protein [Hymenobacter jeongseonensis]